MQTSTVGRAIGKEVASLAAQVFVSIIIPVYNTPAPALRRAVRSILVQSHSNFEALLVDDGSDEKCRRELEDVEQLDSRIRLICAGHQGVSHARNVAMDEARGEWIAFVDADDEVEPGYLSEAVGLAVAYDSDFVIGALQTLYVGHKKESQSDSGNVYVYRDASSLTSAARQMLGTMKCKHFIGPNYRGRGPVAKLYRADLAKAQRFDESITNGEDVLFNYQYMQRCSSVVVTERVWYWYYQNAGSAVHSVNVGNWKRSLIGLMRAMKHDDEKPEFYTRCVFLAYEALASFVRSGSMAGAKRPSIELFETCESLGCLDPPIMEGFECPWWYRLLVSLCRGRCFVLAFYFAAIKVKVADIVRSRKGLFDTSAVEEVDEGAQQ